MRQRLEKGKKNLLLENLCWPESTWGWDTPEGGRAQPVPCPCPPIPLGTLSATPHPPLHNRFGCSSSQNLENLGGMQPQDLQGLREMGIFLLLLEELKGKGPGCDEMLGTDSQDVFKWDVPTYP